MKAKPRAGFHEELQACPPGRFIWLGWNVRAGIGISWSGAIWRRVLSARLRSLEFNLHNRQEPRFPRRDVAGGLPHKEWSQLM